MSSQVSLLSEMLLDEQGAVQQVLAFPVAKGSCARVLYCRHGDAHRLKTKNVKGTLSARFVVSEVSSLVVIIRRAADERTDPSLIPPRLMFLFKTCGLWSLT